MDKQSTGNKENIIYGLNYEKLKTLTGYQVMLINEIQKYCEINSKFPNEKQLTKKNGYVSRTQFYKHFDINKFNDIYEYIYPITEEKPMYHECNKCLISKEFTTENFSQSKQSKFGLSKICRECENKYVRKRNYEKKGIQFDMKEDISPVEWWKYLQEGKIRYLPEFCLTEGNIIKITRYVLLEYLDLSKEQICKMNLYDLKNVNLFHFYRYYNNKLKYLQLCFPELNIRSTDLLMSTNITNEEKKLYIEEWMNNNNFDVSYLLNNTFSRSKDMESFIQYNFKSLWSMLLWYFDEKKITHPITNFPITIHDFKYKPNHYWDKQENRILNIRKYCIENGINEALRNTQKLKLWVFNNFKSEFISSMFPYSNYYSSLYDALVDAFPIIKNNKLLFEWEWHQWNSNNNEFLIRMLREMIEHRENLAEPTRIAQFLRYKNMMENGYNKFVKHVQRGRFKNFYEWACLSFPEYKSEWKLSDFSHFIASDGTVCDSNDELLIYDFVQKTLKLPIEAIGTKIISEHTFYPKNGFEKMYCPDFIINDEIYIEYFGMYTEKYAHNKLLNKYKNKTNRKIEFYKNTGKQFIFLFPDDLKNNYEGLIKKFAEKGIEIKL